MKQAQHRGGGLYVLELGWCMKSGSSLRITPTNTHQIQVLSQLAGWPELSSDCSILWPVHFFLKSVMRCTDHHQVLRINPALEMEKSHNHFAVKPTVVQAGASFG